MKQIALFLFLTGAACIVAAQTKKPKVKLLTSGEAVSIRGLSVVDDNTVWVSGAKGTVGLSLNGGADWKWMKVKGFDSTDFRDIEAFSRTEAIIMGIGEPAYILKTINGGETWKVVYENRTPGMFLDAMEFWNEQSGIVIGDPIGGRFFFSRTFDGGETWKNSPVDKRPVADSGEACFASSGTNIRALDKDEACFISGGLKSRLYVRDAVISLPILQGKESTGANSIAVAEKKKCLLIVGGDFNLRDSIQGNCILSFDQGKTWRMPQKPPSGYRSCVEFIGKKKAITCGLNGVDYTEDYGLNWQKISDTGFHVCRMAKTGKSVFFAGGGGRIGKLVFE
jgi:photosystem II stability/assembly factor-like uncharacterized protein